MVVFRSEFTDSKAMAAVHAAIRLVSPIETTIHAGQVIALLPGKSGTLNVFVNDDIFRFKESNEEEIDNFIESFGDEFKNIKEIPVLVRTGAHFYGPGDRQFITVVYSGSGRGVFNFTADSTTHPLQKLYHTEFNNQIYITNTKKDTKDKFLGYALFDIPACTSEIQTDILICREDGPSSTSGGTPKVRTGRGTVSTAVSVPTSMSDDARKTLAKNFVKVANEYRKNNTGGGDPKDDIKQNLMAILARDSKFKDEYDQIFDYLYKQINLTDDGYYSIPDPKKAPLGLKHISIDEYKGKINEIRDLTTNEVTTRLGKFKTKIPNGDLKRKSPEQKLAIKKRFIAEQELNLPKECIPQDLDFWDVSKTTTSEPLDTAITKCAEMRPETAV